MFNCSEELPFNSLVTVQDGIKVGQRNKWMLGNNERGNFKKAITPEPTMVDETIGTLICSDIAVVRVHDIISPQARTLLLSACWAVPGFDGFDHTRERYERPLRMAADWAFDVNPNLLEIVVADRTTAASGLDIPFNAHFRRT